MNVHVSICGAEVTDIGANPTCQLHLEPALENWGRGAGGGGVEAHIFFHGHDLDELKTHRLAKKDVDALFNLVFRRSVAGFSPEPVAQPAGSEHRGSRRIQNHQKWPPSSSCASGLSRADLRHGLDCREGKNSCMRLELQAGPARL